MKSKSIFVTGGAGYVGSVVIPELVNHGHVVKCLDRFFFGMDYLSQKQFENKVKFTQSDPIIKEKSWQNIKKL